MHTIDNYKKIKPENCACCGKNFESNEMKVSYDFEHFYCIQCDDNRQTLAAHATCS
ncbi:MAG: hypothetical protein QXL17_03765 [Candidatus Thermoplasmatota archaeon]